MNTEVQAYIDRINDNDAALTSICLECLGLSDADIAPLMEVLAANYDAAQRITKLDFAYNQLTSINVQGLTALTELYLCNNQLTSIDVQGLAALTELNLRDNQLASIDVQGLTALKNLYLNNNQLASLDVQGLVALIRLDLGNNQLTSVNVQGLTALRGINLKSNQLTNIYVQDLTALKWLDLGSNQLKNINVQGLTALTRLDLDNNPLTDATKIALNAWRIRRVALYLSYYGQRRINTILTTEILDTHFKPMLRVNIDEALHYAKKIGALHLLSSLPVGIVRIISKMLCTPEIERAYASMANFQSIFSMLPDGESPQSGILNAYKNTRFKALINVTERYYGGVFDSIDGIIIARREAVRLSTAATINPVLFSQASPVAKKVRNDAGGELIKRGFLLHKNGI